MRTTGLSEAERRPRPGSQSALRGRNRQRIVDALREAGPLTQAELSRRTGLSAATISNIVRLLADEGAVSTDTTTSSGRRATSVRLSDDGRLVVGLDFGRRHARIVLVTPGYEVVAERAIELPRGYPALEGVRAVRDVLDDLMAERGVRRSAVLAAGLGMPGPIDRRSGTVVQGTILPEWIGVTADDLSEQLDIPVLLDNDANLGALAEVSWGAYSEVENLMFVKIGSGIGSGLIINGKPYYGNIGVTGEIGHTTINEQGAVCHCGNRGCLETVASTVVMLELLYRRAPGSRGTADIVRRALEGDPGTLRVLEDAGAAIGAALGNTANLINPEVILIGGPLAPIGPAFLEPIARSFGRHAVPRVGDSTAIAMGSLGDRAEALGGASLALRHVDALALL
ncbi:ROK family transcriptional regulator [Schumannella sp. 10F1B-5-1]|uniref:ROK family transcriptional regulator n=1 Tax=Schumannella sp. 10F1B-5-1 TaxID=2590780 RepID=UPI0011311E5F|nr:ROK family transcriptional regulator [Schumannella sp. 10F1B-5-1]TPW73439.1 ROK family transcriptional regulator [Schumannella sp. 10F1B-5-1]